MSEPIHPMELIKRELKERDLNGRIELFSNIGLIAEEMGLQVVCSKLIPLLELQIKGEEDEALLALAEHISLLGDVIGASNIHLLVPLFLALLASEETAVQQRALASFKKIIDENASSEILFAETLAGISEFSYGNWFTLRKTAALLVGLVYPYLDAPEKRSLENILVALSKEKNPLIKRAVAKAIADICPSATEDEAIQNHLPITITLSRDEQDSTRLLAITLLISLSSKTADALAQKKIFEAFCLLQRDSSWRVRYTVAKEFDGYFSVIITHLKKTDFLICKEAEILGLFLQLANDDETEVRIATSMKIKAVAEFFDKETVLANIVPVIRALSLDGVDLVRSEIALSIGRLSAFLGKEHAFTALGPVFIQLLGDDSSNVRINAMRGLKELNGSFELEEIEENFFLTLERLSHDPQWRVRKMVVETFSEILDGVPLAYFEEKMKPFCFGWLLDPVHGVKMQAIRCIGKMLVLFGEEWTTRIILPEINTLSQSTEYDSRKTSLYLLQHLLERASFKTVSEILLPMITAHAYDPISNIRLIVAKTLASLVEIFHLKESVDTILRSQLKRVLEFLSIDKDADVSFYAEKTLLSFTKEPEQQIKCFL
eukprot:GHVN01045789.1.p1 GENE.GHVN01045789.1~~GHVN01045789.1.p1  ORF type:complete len:604 (+),score=61.95 GHVN01045789.1:3599-5410(+)